jgi:hypothetical protein
MLTVKGPKVRREELEHTEGYAAEAAPNATCILAYPVSAHSAN